MVCHADARDAVAHGRAVRGRRAVSRSVQRRARRGRHRGHLPPYVRPHRAAALHHRRAPGAGRAGLRHLAVHVPAARPALPDCRRQPPALQPGRPGGAAPRLLGRYRGITGKAAADRRANTLAARAFPRAPSGRRRSIRREPGMSAATAPKPARAAIPSLIGWLLLTAVAAALGALASARAAQFYAQLERPAWAPPAWLFAGGSHLRFNQAGLVVLHRDYWDATEELLAKLPLVGAPIRWLRGRFRVPLPSDGAGHEHRDRAQAGRRRH